MRTRQPAPKKGREATASSAGKLLHTLRLESGRPSMDNLLVQPGSWSWSARGVARLYVILGARALALSTHSHSMSDEWRRFF